MKLKDFQSDQEIVIYLKQGINEIVLLNECRLTREEQLQLTQETIEHRNCVEWIIRSNKVIENIKYALNKSLFYAEKMENPIEETADKKLYSYFLEDAVYRDIVLWDVFRQLLNELYKCGYDEHEEITIFKFLRNERLQIGEDLSKDILLYLNSTGHKIIRKELRNSFTHSVESTSSYVFHRIEKGKLKPQIEHLIPKHPYENIKAILDDVKELISFMNNQVKIISDNLVNKIGLYNVFLTFPCGKHDIGNELWNLENLRKYAERLICPCESKCKYSDYYEEQLICKPIKLEYNRHNGQKGKFIGEIEMKLNISETKKIYDIYNEE